jgi:leader peptidase (prepilin peptidase)/N-methyltransferase
MNIFLYVIIFAMGITFGSFYTLAVYRIPKKIDIVKTHSFCPNCGHKLGFFELIPVLSYIILGGKCKECKQKIKSRYLILELLSGIVFVLIALGLNIKIDNIKIDTLIRFAFIILYLVAIFLIAGIDKDYKKIEKSVLYYGFVVSLCYIIYLCIVGSSNIYRYVMYLITLIILLFIDNIKQIKEAKESYLIETLMLILIMLINTDFWVTFLSVLIVCLAIAITELIFYIKNAFNKSKKERRDMSEIYIFGYLFSVTNIVLFIGYLYCIYH